MAIFTFLSLLKNYTIYLLVFMSFDTVKFCTSVIW